MRSYRRTLSVAIALCTAFAFVGFYSVSAQAAKKKMTYEEAFAKCKQEIATVDQVSQRYAAGGSCMKKYGYRLKKGSNI